MSDVFRIEFFHRERGVLANVELSDQDKAEAFYRDAMKSPELARYEVTLHHVVQQKSESHTLLACNGAWAEHIREMGSFRKDELPAGQRGHLRVTAGKKLSNVKAHRGKAL